MNAFIIDIALKSLLITAIATILIPLLLHRASAAARHFAWFLTTLSLLILPLATYFLPALPLIPNNTIIPQITPTTLTTSPTTITSTPQPAPHTSAGITPDPGSHHLKPIPATL